MRKANKKGVSEPLDIYNMLQDIPKTSETTQLWNTLLPSFKISPLSENTAWSKSVDRGNNFWLRAISDLPRPLGQILAMKPERLWTPKVHKILTPKQILSRHPDYDTCVLVVKELTCLCRSDGILLWFKQLGLYRLLLQEFFSQFRVIIRNYWEASYRAP